MLFREGEIHFNRSLKYLHHCLKDCPKWLTDYLLKLNAKKEYANIVGFFRGDLEYSDATGDKNNHLLFVLVDINGEYVEKLNKYKSIELGRRDFKTFLKEFRKNHKWGYYDYVFGDLYHSHRHVFVINLGNWSKSIEMFDEGKYSQMFTDEELKRLGITKTIGGNPNHLYLTFKADKTAKSLFQTRIRNEFGTVLSEKDMEDVTELDIKFLPQDEILNYKK